MMVVEIVITTFHINVAEAVYKMNVVLGTVLKATGKMQLFWDDLRLIMLTPSDDNDNSFYIPDLWYIDFLCSVLQDK